MRPAVASGQDDSFGPGMAGQQGRSLLECFMEAHIATREGIRSNGEQRIVLSLNRIDKPAARGCNHQPHAAVLSWWVEASGPGCLSLTLAQTTLWLHEARLSQ